MIVCPPPPGSIYARPFHWMWQWTRRRHCMQRRCWVKVHNGISEQNNSSCWWGDGPKIVEFATRPRATFRLITGVCWWSTSCKFTQSAFCHLWPPSRLTSSSPKPQALPWQTRRARWHKAKLILPSCWLSQWQTFKLLEITYLLGKLKFKLLFYDPLTD